MSHIGSKAIVMKSNWFLQKLDFCKGVELALRSHGLLLTGLPCLFHKIPLGSTRCNQSNNIKLDGVGPVDNRPSTD